MSQNQSELIDLLDLKKSALLVIDLQNGFCHKDGNLGQSGVDTDRLSSVIPPLKKVIERCNEVGMPVLWTVQEHFEKDERRARKRLPSHTSKRKKITALAGTWDAEIVEELKDLITNPSYVIRKHRFGAFYETRLNVLLEMLGVETLFVTGLTTNACVDTSFREAYLRDFDVVGIEDCISGVNPEWEAPAKKVWQHYLGITVDSDNFLQWVEKEQQPKTLGLAHLALQVSDFDKSVHFYVDLLGFEPRKNTVPLADGRPLVSTIQGLGITTGGPGDQIQLDHMAFEVSKVEALAEKLKANDVTFVKDVAPGAYGLTIYVKDPDGNIVELFEVI